MSQDGPPRPKRRFRRVLYALGAVCGLTVLGLFSGLPQRAIAERVLSRELGGTVTVEGLRTFGTIRASRVDVSAVSTDGEILPALATIQGLRVEYSISGLFDRALGLVHADAVRLNFDARKGHPSNFAFLSERPEGPAATAINNRWLPERVEIDRLNVVAAVNESRATVRGLRVGCAFPGDGSAELRVSGPGMELQFSGMVEGLEPKSVAGDLLVVARLQGSDANITANAVLERTGDLNLSADVKLAQSWMQPGAELRALDATLDSASLDGRVLGEFLDGLTNGDVGFDTLIAEPSHVQFDFAKEGGMPAIHGGVLVQGLHVRAGGQTFYDGDMAIGANVPGGEISEGTLKLELDDSDVITARVNGSRSAGTVTLEGERWEKHKLMALLPPVTHPFVEDMNFDRADLSGRVQWTTDGVESAGNMVAVGQNEPFARFSARFPKHADWIADGHLQVGAGTVDAKYTGRALESFDASSKFENLHLKDALELAAGDLGDLHVGGTVSGTVTAQTRPESDYFTYEGSAKISNFEMAPVTFDSFTAEMQGRLSRAGDRAELSHITLDAGDGVSRVNLSDVSVQLDPFYVDAQLLAGLDLSHVARWYDWPDLFGELEVHGPIGFADSVLRLPVTAECGPLGYWDLVLPYRTKIEAEIDAQYDLDKGRGRLEACKAHIGDGTRVLVSRGEFGFDPFELGRTYYEVDTDLALGSAMGLFADVQGNAASSGYVSLASDKLTGEWSFNSDIGTVAFPQQIASAEALAIRASGTFEDGIQGSGSASAKTVTIARGRITDVSGDMKVIDSVVSLPDLRGDVFNGRFAGQVSAHILEPGLPAEISGRLTEFDLARFTEEVQPPDTRLTGIADATFSVRNTLDGPEDLQVHATCTQDFSLNRDSVQKILESDAFKGTFGIGQVEKTVDKFLGKAPQRPFESAELTLGDEGDRLRGKAILLSQKTKDYNGLNLTIELAIDDEALVETLQMLQQGEGVNVHF